jgi:hypothetical protein
VMALPQWLLNLEMPSISASHAGKIIAAGYFSCQWLLEVEIGQGHVQRVSGAWVIRRPHTPVVETSR